MNPDPDSSSAMDLVALQAQLAAQNTMIAQLREQVASLTRHDPLTGVMNRATLIEMLETELVRSHRTGHPFCFAMVDLDRFEAINSAQGVSVGDAVLKKFADASTGLMRALDRFGRLDGGTFGIVLPATWLDSGVIAMNRLRAAVAASDWAAIAPHLSVTFSAGLTTNATADTAGRILQRAEKGLLQAKAQGRDRSVTIEQALPDLPSP